MQNVKHSPNHTYIKKISKAQQLITTILKRHENKHIILHDDDDNSKNNTINQPLITSTLQPLS